MKFRRLALGFVFAIASCARSEGALDISGTHPLLEEPYPLNYPSTAPKPNRVLRNLKDERVTLLGSTADKDFLVYEVRTNEGLEGYVIADDKVIAVVSE